MTSSDHAVSVLLMSLGFYPTRGGAELRFRRYLPRLRQRGVATSVLSGTPEARKIVESDYGEDWYHRRPGEALSMAMVEGTPVHRIRLPERGADQRSEMLAAELLRRCRKPDAPPDAVQLLTTLRPPLSPYLSQIRSLGIPIVYAHTSNVQWPSNPIKRWVRRTRFRGICRHIDCMIASSSAARDVLRQSGVRNRIEVIPNGVDLKRFRPARDEQERSALRTSLGIPPGARVIVFVGTINPLKGVDLLLEAWVPLARRFPEAHLYLVGMRHDLNMPQLRSFKEKLEALVAASQAAPRVHFLGYIGNVEDYLRAADIMAFPSRTEGMGNAVLEAMASGVATVLTPYLGLPPEFGAAESEYLMADYDAGILAGAMERLLADAEFRRRIGGNALAWVERTMDVERVLDRYAALYREVAAGRRRG